MLTFISVFVTMVFLDFVWAAYTIAISEKKAIRAGLTSIVIIVGSGYITREYVEDPWQLIPAGLGAFAGTAACVGREKLVSFIRSRLKFHAQNSRRTEMDERIVSVKTEVKSKWASLKKPAQYIVIAGIAAIVSLMLYSWVS